MVFNQHPKLDILNKINNLLSDLSLIQEAYHQEKQNKLLKQSNIKIIEINQNNTTMIPSVFKTSGKTGDYAWMIKQRAHAKDLFIFNDNIRDHKSSYNGANSAVVRMYNRYTLNPTIPRSAGISTGFKPGKGGEFKKLSKIAKKAIDSDINEIKELINKYDYVNVYWPSCDISGSCLGTGIFKPGKDVLKYIFTELTNLNTWLKNKV